MMVDMNLLRTPGECAGRTHRCRTTHYFTVGRGFQDVSREEKKDALVKSPNERHCERSEAISQFLSG
jgi:hypothetical protein